MVRSMNGTGKTMRIGPLTDESGDHESVRIDMA